MTGTAAEHSTKQVGSAIADQPAERHSSSSSDWEVMGDSMADARAAVYAAAPLLPHGASAHHGAWPQAHGAPDTMHAQLQRRHEEALQMAQRPQGGVPLFETGEPQYTYGDGGGPPASDDSMYQEVADTETVTGSNEVGSTSGEGSAKLSALSGL